MDTTQDESSLAIPQEDLWGVGTGLILLSIIIRIASYPIETSDYVGFLSNWFALLASHPGLSAFQNVFSDYTPLYLYFLKILTFIPAPSLYSIKTLSLSFDIAIAFFVACILHLVSKGSFKASRLYLAGAIMFALPTLLINSSLWGQSDAVYAIGCVISLYCILKKRPLLAALVFGCAVSIKLQAIFFLPVLIGYYLRRSRDAWYLLCIPGVYIFTLLPAWFAGASFQTLLFTYINQSGEYKDLSVSAPSVFAFVQQHALTMSDQNTLFFIGIGVAALCALWVVAVMSRTSISTPGRTILFLAMLSTLVVPLFLPRMHERYFYLADIFSTLYALSYPRKWYIAAIVVSASLISYMPYLSGQVALLSSLHIDLRIPAGLLLMALLLMIPDLVAIMRSQGVIGKGGEYVHSD